jgi:hypothetical protein
MKIEHAGVREGNTLWQLHGGRTAGGGEEPINFAAERAKRAAEAAAAAAAADGLDVPPPPRPPGFEGDWPPDPKLWPWPGMPDHDPLAAEMWREFGWG